MTVVRRTTSDFSFFKAEDKKVCERAKCSAPSFTPRHRHHFASVRQRAEQLERTHVRCPTACTCASCCVEPNPILLTLSSLTNLSPSSQTTPSENPGGYGGYELVAKRKYQQVASRRASFFQVVQDLGAGAPSTGRIKPCTGPFSPRYHYNCLSRAPFVVRTMIIAI